MRIFHPLRSTPVALLWGGLSLSALGDQLYAVALTWIAVGVLGAKAGYLGALQAFVALLAVLGIGKWADRLDQMRAMIGADLTCTAILLAIVAIWLAAGGPDVAQLICAIVALAIGQAVFQPALQTVLPSLVYDPRLLPAATGLLDATNRSARLLGPGLVALLAGIFPMVHFLTLDAASFLASAAALLLVGRIRPGTIALRRARETAWRNVVRGYRATAAHPLLGYLLFTTGLLNGTWFAVFYLGLPLLIARHGVGGQSDAGLGAYGLILSAYGCTNLASTVIFGSRALPFRPQFQMFGGNVVTGCGMTILGLVSFLPAEWRLPACAAAAALAAIGGPMTDIPKAVLRQLRVNSTDVAASVRAQMAMNGAGTLLAMMIAPTALVLFGTVPVIVACGAVYIAIGAIGMTRFTGWVEAQEQPA